MIYTLIIIAEMTRFGTIGGAGIAIHSIEFNSEKSCEIALKKTKSMKRQNSMISAVCTEKGINNDQE